MTAATLSLGRHIAWPSTALVKQTAPPECDRLLPVSLKARAGLIKTKRARTRARCSDYELCRVDAGGERNCFLRSLLQHNETSATNAKSAAGFHWQAICAAGSSIRIAPFMLMGDHEATRVHLRGFVVALAEKGERYSSATLRNNEKALCPRSR